MLALQLNQDLDVAVLREAYGRHGRIQIGDFLAVESARALFDALMRSTEWKLTYNRGELVHDHDRAAYARLEPDERRMLSDAIVAGGRDGFQFCYDTIRGRNDVPSDPPLAAFTAFLNSAPLLDLLRGITGADDVETIDAHASRYGPGQFLTTHDDRIATRGRRAAYVMNLTPRWRPDWGGLLLFYDAQGNVVRGFTPGFNVLNLFAVPQAHSVSWVNQLAAVPRVSITGWLLGPDPA